jgi:hypothetical protein
LEQVSKGTAIASKKVNVAGFEIQVPDQKASEEIKKHLVEEAANGKVLRDKLHTADIKPIVILPEDIFQKLVEKAGFYTFSRMTPEGKVYGNGKELNKEISIIPDSEGGFGVFCFLSFALSVMSVLSVAKIGFVLYGAPILIAFICGIYLNSKMESESNRVEIWLLVVMAVLFTPMAYLFMIDEVLSSKSFLKIFGGKKMKKILWPKKNDVDGVTDDLFQITLPTPPAYITSILRKCHEHTIDTFLVVDERAFNVIIDGKRMKELRAKYDPIICKKENGMVAVLAQFGDFPEEKEVVEYIREHFSAMRKNLIPN